MTVLNEKEKKSIIQNINSNLHEYVSRYPSTKYPEEPYLEWRQLFSNPANVQSDHIKQALNWKYGHWGKRNNVAIHNATIGKYQKYWPEFCKLNSHDEDTVFAFWDKKIKTHHHFIPTAFILHLMYPDKIEIVDQQRFKALHEIIHAVSPRHLKKTKAVLLENILSYSDLFQSLLPKISIEGDPKRELDKFLIVYGSNHLLNAARNQPTPKIDPLIKHFTWDILTSKLYDFTHISHRSNADVLFACLLLALEQRNPDQATSSLSIRDIADLIPQGTGGISNYASYNYAMIALFGGQKGRVYFQVNNSALKEAFTKEANNSARNINFWKEHVDESVAINPKYLLGDGEKKATNSK